MEKFLFVICVFLVTFNVNAQDKKQVTIKGGTIVPLEAIKEVRGATADEGQKVNFKVSRDVVVDGVIAIPAGTIAKGTIYEAKRSSWWGTRGRLGIRLNYLTLPSGDNVSFAASDIYIKGINRTALSVATSLLICPFCCFICGSKAIMPMGYEFDATVAVNTLVTVE